MAGVNERRWGAVAAFATVILWIIGFFIAGKPPAFNAPAATVVDYFRSNHKEVLIGAVLVAIGILLYLFAMSQLRLVLRGAGQRSAATQVGLCAGASAALFAVGDAIYGTLGQAVQDPEADAGVAKTMYQLDQFAGMPMYWIVIGIVFAVTTAVIRGLFIRLAVVLNSLIVILLILGGISVKASGAFAAGTGFFASIAFAAALVFLVEVGILLWTAKDPEPAAR
jgi:hypothetical protein